MKDFVFLTTGQGSQTINMGLDWLEFVDKDFSKQKLFESVFGFNAREALTNSDKINNTLYAQPLIVFITALIGDYLKENNYKPKYYAGFSLGELSSLYLADYFDLKTLFEIIKIRSHLMNDASLDNPGGMAAVIGNDLSNVKKICMSVSNDLELVVVANDNSLNQVVISGHLTKINEVTPLLKELGLKVIPLKVSGAFHSPLMIQASTQFKKYLEENVTFNKPTAKVISNYTSLEYLSSVEDIINLLTNQIVNPVRWVDTINYINNQNIFNFIEIGSGKVLSGLVSKINSDNNCITINNVNDLTKLNIEERV